MYSVPAELQGKFSRYLEQKRVAPKEVWFFLKWLRYFPDFCLKHLCGQTENSAMNRFLEKLREKGKTAAQV